MSEETAGLEPEQLVRSVYNAYRLCRDGLGALTEDWEEIADRDGWMAAANAGAAILEANEGATVKASEIAKAMYAAKTENDGLDISPTFAQLPDHLRLLWEALARHLCNCLQYDPEDHGSIERHEEQIGAWYGAKCEEIEKRVSAEGTHEQKQTA